MSCIPLWFSLGPHRFSAVVLNHRTFPLANSETMQKLPVMITSRTYPMRKISLFKGWQQLSVSLGYPVEEILTKSSLPPELAQQEHAEMTREQFFRFWRVMLADKSARELADWFLSLVEAGMAAPYLAALCSRNLRSAFLLLAKYKPIIAPVRMHLTPCPGGEWVAKDWGTADVPFSLALVELCALRQVAEKGTGRKVVPLRVQIPGAENFPDSIARELLGVPVEPGPIIRIAFAKEDLDAPFPSSNPVTLKLLEESLQQKFSAESGCFLEELRCALKRLMADQRITLEDIAKELSCSTRTLQRKLHEEGTSFREMLEDTRRELALSYLGKVRLSPKEVSFMLGFSEPSTFYRAFRRWTGHTPSKYADSMAPESKGFASVEHASRAHMGSPNAKI